MPYAYLLDEKVRRDLPLLVVEDRVEVGVRGQRRAPEGVHPLERDAEEVDDVRVCVGDMWVGVR